MDKWLENVGTIAQADLAGNSMNFRMTENTREEKPIFILRGWCKTKVSTLRQKTTDDSAQFKMNTSGIMRGFGRDGTFYLLFNNFLKTKKKVPTKTYNYWRGAGKPKK